MRMCWLLLLGLLLGCATTAEITHTWVADDIADKNYSGVLVLAISDNIEARRLYERRFTDALREHGVNAVASYELTGDGKVEKEDILAASSQAGLELLM